MSIKKLVFLLKQGSFDNALSHIESSKDQVDWKSEKSPSGLFALHHAARLGATRVCQALIDLGCDPCVVWEKNGATPLLMAARAADSPLLELLIQNGSQVNSEALTTTGFTALITAAVSGRLENVQTLLEHNANVNKRCKSGNTALMVAALKGHTEIVKLLLDKNADASCVDQEGATAVLLAAQEGHVDVVQTILDKTSFVDLNQQSTKGFTAIYMASQSGHSEMVKLLLENKAETNRSGDNDSIPLSMAAQLGHEEVVKTLLTAEDVQVNRKSSEGTTPVMLASAFGHENVLKLLIAASADVNAKRTDTNVGALTGAIMRDHASCAVLLLEAKADPNDPNEQLLIQATAHKLPNMVKLLLEHKADPNLKCMDEDGDVATALECAVDMEHKECEKLLREAGAVDS